MSKFDSTALA